MKYIVNVGNIGNIDCKNKAEATKTFNEYVRQSKWAGSAGRAFMEDVCLMVDGEPERDFFYSSWMTGKLQANVDRLQLALQVAQETLAEHKLETGEI